jgi:hypothetical protein
MAKHLQAVFDVRRKSNKIKGDYRDSEFYLSYAQPGAATEKGYVITHIAAEQRPSILIENFFF